jgi:hypothetical protein
MGHNLANERENASVQLVEVMTVTSQGRQPVIHSWSNSCQAD